MLTYAPCDISATKEAHLSQAGVKLIKYGNDCMDAEVKARQVAEVITEKPFLIIIARFSGRGYIFTCIYLFVCLFVHMLPTYLKNW